jgi:hypothetical protein
MISLASSILLASVVVISTAAADYNKLPTSTPAGTVYRLYNPNTGEHFYTTGMFERNSLIAEGWNSEGVGWVSSTTGEPVYRLYNPNAKGGDHYYTKSPFEKDSLTKRGWLDEGVGWYSGGDINVYVAYNPNAQSGAHNYTTGLFEQNSLLENGWKYGSTSWKSVSVLEKTGKLPASKTDSVLSNSDLDSIINQMQKLVLDKGNYQLGSFVTILSNGTYSSDYFANDFKDGVYTFEEISDHNLFPVTTDAIVPPSFMYGSKYYDFTKGHGYISAILTSKGWYLLPDYKLQNSKGMLSDPDYSKFIQTGNIADLKTDRNGDVLVLETTDLFACPILIS